MRHFRILIPVLVFAIAFAACSGGNGTSPAAGMPAVGQNPVSADHIGKFSKAPLWFHLLRNRIRARAD